MDKKRLQELAGINEALASGLYSSSDEMLQHVLRDVRELLDSIYENDTRDVDHITAELEGILDHYQNDASVKVRRHG